MKNSRQSGFSLVELLVAVTVTMIVSGAVYGLLASGQGAFRKEPALSDRQANIRSAMDQIARDLSGAGAGMPPFAQVLAPGLDSPAGGVTSVVVPALGGALSDELMILTDTSGGFPQLICDSHRDLGGHRRDRFACGRWRSPSRSSFPTTAGRSASPRWSTPPRPRAAPARVCTPASRSPVATLSTWAAAGARPQAWEPPRRSSVPRPPLMMSAARVVGYRIRPDATGVPFLEQQTSENWGVWVPIFPGIEDLQVRYQDGDTAGLVAPADFIDTPRPSVSILIPPPPTSPS